MLAKDIISDLFPAVNINDNGEKALVRMDFFKVSHIPLIDDERNYLGLISENEIYDFDLLSKPFCTQKTVLARPFVYCEDHIYDVLGLINKLKISVVPVLTKKDKYKGALCLYDIIKFTGTLTAAGNPGVVFILEVSVRDYSVSQISQIVESNNAQILSLHTTSPEDSTKLNITLKVNTDDFSSIRQTLERYNYTIKAAFSGSDKYNELLEERYDEFMNYLNI
jgi:acetoin utilization protein AcuB